MRESEVAISKIASSAVVPPEEDACAQQPWIEGENGLM
jgi:hypothetical protein